MRYISLALKLSFFMIFDGIMLTKSLKSNATNNSKKKGEKKSSNVPLPPTNSPILFPTNIPPSPTNQPIIQSSSPSIVNPLPINLLPTNSPVLPPIPSPTNQPIIEPVLPPIHPPVLPPIPPPVKPPVLPPITPPVLPPVLSPTPPPVPPIHPTSTPQTNPLPTNPPTTKPPVQINPPPTNTPIADNQLPSIQPPVKPPVLPTIPPLVPPPVLPPIPLPVPAPVQPVTNPTLPPTSPPTNTPRTSAPDISTGSISIDKESYLENRPVTVSFVHSKPTGSDWISIHSCGTNEEVDWENTGGDSTGELIWTTLLAGCYYASLISGVNNSKIAMSRNFNVMPDKSTSITSNKESYSVGEKILINFTSGFPTESDWVSIYTCGPIYFNVDWDWTAASSSGTIEFKDLIPGCYIASLLDENDVEIAYSSEFYVK